MAEDDATEELLACEDLGFVSLSSTREFKLVIRVDATDPDRVFEIAWPEILVYASRSEHMVEWDAAEEWTGPHVFRTYTKSKFRDFVAASTFISDVFPGPYTHYQVQTLYQIVDIASQAPPVVTRGNVA
jgi:hypothetical protein